MAISYTPLQTATTGQGKTAQLLSLATGNQSGNSSSVAPSASPVLLKQPTTTTSGAPAIASATPPSIPAASTPSAPQGSDTETANTVNTNANEAEVGLSSDPFSPGGSFDQSFARETQLSQSKIDAINSSADAQIKEAQDTEAQQEKNVTGGTLSALSAAGLGGSTLVPSTLQNVLGPMQELSEDQINEITAQRQSNVADVMSKIEASANADVSTEMQGEQNAVQAQKDLQQKTLQQVQTLGASGADLNALRTNYPDTYNSLVAGLGGDENLLASTWALSKKPGDVVSSNITGSIYHQITRDPVTGAVSSQSFDLGFTPPVGWTNQKLGTTGTIMIDPNNPANTISYSVNPFTGEPIISGTGSGLQLLNSQGVSTSTDTSTSSSANNFVTGAGTASTTIASVLGVDPTTPLSTVVTQSGIGPVVAAIIKNEGSSPTGVTNNPGNIKYTGAAGQTDSGVKASDGGTYASYNTPQAGQQAIADLVTNPPADEYGTNPTLQDFVNKYTNTGSPQGVGTNGLSTSEYGLAANVQGFDPTKPGVDQAAWNYLNQYLTQGKTPTAASVGISTRTGSGASFNTVAQRADDVYFKATGQHLPNASVLSKNLGLISDNNSLLNNLNVQIGTIKKNFGLNLTNMTANNINQLPPAVNGILDFLQQQSGSTSVAQYLTQNTTLTQELGNLLALKNASGTTVADKLSAESLLSSSLSLDQQKEILNILMSEAKNAQQSIVEANIEKYKQTDPLGLDPNNPINMPGYQEATSIGFIPNGDGTYSSSDGSETVDGQGNPVQ